MPPNLVYEWVDFLKIFPNLSHFLKIWKKRVILLKIWPIRIRMGPFFLKNWYMYGSTFKFCAARSHQNQTWVGLPLPRIWQPFWKSNKAYTSNKSGWWLVRFPSYWKTLLELNQNSTIQQGTYSSSEFRGMYTSKNLCLDITIMRDYFLWNTNILKALYLIC